MERSDTGELVSRWVIAGLSVFVFVGVAVVLFGGLGQARREVGSSILPALNALLNGTSAILLTVGYVCIRRRKVTAHKSCMLTAFVVHDPPGMEGPPRPTRAHRAVDPPNLALRVGERGACLLDALPPRALRTSDV